VPVLNGAKISIIWGILLPRRGYRIQPRVSTHKRRDNARRFDGRMAFVPEGQHDRSQARSAWDRDPRKNRPVGYGMTARS
jgi:hypothetical protein